MTTEGIPTWMTSGQLARATGDSRDGARAWVEHLPDRLVRFTAGGHVRIHQDALDIIMGNRRRRTPGWKKKRGRKKKKRP